MTVSRESRTTLAYVAPFCVYVASMSLERLLRIDGGWPYALRCSLTLAAALVFSRKTVSFTVRNPAASVAVGLLVFVLWVAPDQLWNIRYHWLFDNALTGSAVSSIPTALRRNAAFLALRVGGSALLVPIIEELFWRAWLMRWLISPHIEAVPLGTYNRLAFWVTAAFFAAEHGPYWEVGLVAGIVYNWWMIRTRSLGDCILAHAVTNLALGLFVIRSGQWQYWL
jgi:CAAX prenyl protease-like protein